ncbi:hypothetical protein TNCV_1473191 [Trichonephila clavipes]|nr:hypothetical protein TNCV_1473191 [Trichonephila clavipes]
MGFPTSTQAEYLSMVRCKIPLHRLFCYLFRPLHRRNEVEKSNLYTGCSIYVSRNEFLIKPSRLGTKHSRAKAYEREDHLLSPNFEERLLPTCQLSPGASPAYQVFFCIRTDFLFYLLNKNH